MKFVAAALICAGLSACGGSSSPSNVDSLEEGSASAVEQRSGQYLYNYHCAGCHGEDAKGRSGRPDIRGKTPVGIRLALDSVALMSHLKSLSDDEIQRIADYLQTLVTVTGQVFTSRALWADVEVIDSAGRRWELESNHETGLFELEGGKALWPLVIRAKEKYADMELLGIGVQKAMNVSPVSDLVVRSICTDQSDLQVCLAQWQKTPETFRLEVLEASLGSLMGRYEVPVDRLLFGERALENPNMVMLLQELMQNRSVECSNRENPMGLWLDNDMNGDCFPDQ